MAPNEVLTSLAGRILVLSLQASLLIGVILGVRVLVRDRWPAQWQASLWLFLVAGLLLPWRPTLSSRASQRVPQIFHEPAPGAKEGAGLWVGRAAAVRPFAPSALALPTMLAGLWLAGAALLALRLALASRRLQRAVRLGRVVTSERVLEVLEGCKRDLGVHTLLGIVATDQVRGPALSGFIRPRLLLPPALVEGLSEQELRHVFLHELAHLKRLDIHWGWLCAALQVLHWFNPVVWYAFHLLRADRELACDEVALAQMAPSATPDYGRTLLKLLEPLPPRELLPGLAAVSENGVHFKRRILMIARSAQPPRRPWTWASSMVFAFVALCALGVKLKAQDPLLPGRPIFDRVDYPFVNDPELLGGWRSVDYVKEPQDFKPGQRQWKDDLFLKELYVKPGGSTSWAWTWTRGLFLHDGERTASRYEIQSLAGGTYLFFEWKSGDYTYLHRKPHYYVLVKDPGLVVPETRVADKVDYPFVDDPAVRGVWKAVDFVRTPELFHPGHRAAWGDLYLERIEFLEGGRSLLGFKGGQTVDRILWTRGLVLDAKNRVAPRYQIQRLEGRTFMFFEWKSGDYTRHAMAPQYYVLEKTP